LLKCQVHVRPNTNRDIPPGAPPVQHNSGSMRSTPAGGTVLPDQYVGRKLQHPHRHLRRSWNDRAAIFVVSA
jgi:hypothetical protein